MQLIRRITIAAAAAALGAAGFGVGTASAEDDGDGGTQTGPPPDLHCPDHNGHPGKVESAEGAGGLVLDDGTVFCAKKGTGHTGTQTADGDTTLYDYLVAAGIDGAQGEGPSYYIVYSTPTVDPEPRVFVRPTFICVARHDGPSASVPGDLVDGRYYFRVGRAGDAGEWVGVADTAFTAGVGGSGLFDGTIGPGDELFFSVDAPVAGVSVQTTPVANSHSGTASTNETNACKAPPADDTDPTLSITALTPLCIADVPYIDFAAAIDGAPFVSGTLSFVDENDEVIESHTITSLTGRVLYPGASVDADGTPNGWPGWRFENGTWIADPATAIWRDGLTVVIEVNPAAQGTVVYPAATDGCVGPELGGEHEQLPPATTTPSVTAPVTTPEGAPPPSPPAEEIVQLPPPATAPAAPEAAAPEPVTTLPATGTGTAITAIAALLALLGGLGLVALARRPTRTL